MLKRRRKRRRSRLRKGRIKLRKVKNPLPKRTKRKTIQMMRKN